MKNVLPNWLLIELGVKQEDISPFSFDPSGDVKTDIQVKYGFNGELLDIFVNSKHGAVHKWHHYLPLYDRYFQRFRGKRIRFLEIGVAAGGSLQMWRDYLGDKAIIFGIDVDPNCAMFDGQAANVRIGSQNDPTFLDSVIDEMGGLDVVLDDGSHQMSDITKTLSFLFPRLNDDGIYVIEDLHTAYWRGYGGGVRSSSNFLRSLSAVIQDMHHWYHTARIRNPVIAGLCSGIHVHDSVVVLEKSVIHKPTHSRRPPEGT